jgi:mxaK protein
MALNVRRVTRGVLAAAAVVLAAGLLDAALLWRDLQRNAQIAGGTVPADSIVPEHRFALAHALAASGAADAALEAYRPLQADPRLGSAARFNSAELAKEQYRELLRQDPQHWDARYNLERAQRLQPDPADDGLEPAAAPRERERAATTMRAQSPGLP